MTLDAPIDRIADAYVDAVAAADPVLATNAGIPGHDREMTDYSPAGFARREELTRRTLGLLGGLAPDGPRESVALSAMRERLAVAVEYADAGLDRVLNVISSPVQEVRAVFDLMPTDTDDDWDAIATRLAAVPEALAGYRATLSADVAAGWPPSTRQVEACVTMARGWVAQGIFAALAAGYAGDGALRSDLERGVAAADGAYDRLATSLETDVAPYARAGDGCGRAAYPLASRYFLGADIDLDETYAWGWDELHRIEAEMRDTAAEIVPGGTTAEAMSALDADPARRIEGGPAFRDWMQALSDAAVDALAGTHFDIPDPIRRLECMLAPTHDGGIYYTGPSDDLSRPGRMWWSVPPGEETFSTWAQVSTVYHEGVPGHHLQVAQAVVNRDNLNRWQRLLCWVSGHGEGWALYAERLMGELGFLDDPGARLGMLDAQQLRAARVVLDIGVHCALRLPAGAGMHEGEVWDADIAQEFLAAHASIGEGMRRFELNRYLGWPGQAPSYKIGERLWLELREQARHREGAAFDLREFHRRALDLGSLGLDPLREALAPA